MSKVLCCAGLVLAAACGGDRRSAADGGQRQEQGQISLAVPGRTNSAPSTAAWGKTVAVVWTASSATQSDIYVSVSEDSGATFAAPTLVNDVAGDARASGEQPARLAIGSGNAMHVVWPSKDDGVSVIRYASSIDNGKTFAKATTIAGERLTGARGWQAVTVGYDGGVHLVWLDGRNAAAHHEHAMRGSQRHGGAGHPAGMTVPRQDLFHVAWTKDGMRSESAVAARVCFCCKTAIATAGEHVYAAWRHIFPGGIRDIAVARSDDNGVTFGEPARVSDDGWKIDACPDDGPAMVADGHGRLHLTWPTMMPSAPPHKAIFYATLAEDGHFTQRLRIDAGDGDPSHPQIASDEHGHSAVVWDEIVNGVRRIGLRQVAEGSAAPAQYFDDRSGEYPAVAAADGAWVIIWASHPPNGGSSIVGRRLRFTAAR
ncbi:MAG TPA: hypothetical protein VFJ02_08185 [Vicinamibacterales bacterium]|nr:hypothetical protein [Vicinamibacterales bacterium]